MIGKLGTQLGDIKLWQNDLGVGIEALGAMDEGAFRKWVAFQLRDNLAPLLEAEARAVSHELGEIHEGLTEIGDVVNEMIEHEESFLRPEVGEQLAGTIQLGMELCAFIDEIGLDELSRKKAENITRKYKQQALLALDEIEQIMAEDDEDEGEDDDARSGLHDEGGHSEGTDTGRESTAGATGDSKSTDAPQGEGGE